MQFSDLISRTQRVESAAPKLSGAKAVKAHYHREMRASHAEKAKEHKALAKEHQASGHEEKAARHMALHSVHKAEAEKHDVKYKTLIGRHVEKSESPMATLSKNIRPLIKTLNSNGFNHKKEDDYFHFTPQNPKLLSKTPHRSAQGMLEHHGFVKQPNRTWMMKHPEHGMAVRTDKGFAIHPYGRK